MIPEDNRMKLEILIENLIEKIESEVAFYKESRKKVKIFC